MSDETDDTLAGTAQVRINPKVIYKAVKNYCTHELRLEPEAIKAEATKVAQKVADETVHKLITQYGYDETRLRQRVEGAVNAEVARVGKIVKEVVDAEVKKQVTEWLEKAVLEMMVKAVEFKLGVWSGDPTAKVTVVQQETK